MPDVSARYVPDPLLKARKALVESKAYLELGKIFKGMGLLEGAVQKCQEGVDLVETVITERSPIPQTLRE